MRYGILLYDGECGFCASFARFLERSIHRDTAYIAFQEIGETKLHAVGITLDDCKLRAHYIATDGVIFAGARAFNALVRSGPVPISSLVRFIERHKALIWIEDAVYAGVARNRAFISRVLGTAKYATTYNL